jgi:hypothetical protein
MLAERSRFLLLLILLLVVATAGWTTALASGKTDSSDVSSSLVSVLKPTVVPASGEPDVGQTPRAVVAHGSMSTAPRGEGGGSQGPRAGAWFRWVFRMWAIRYLGAR